MTEDWIETIELKAQINLLFLDSFLIKNKKPIRQQTLPTEM